MEPSNERRDLIVVAAVGLVSAATLFTVILAFNPNGFFRWGDSVQYWNLARNWIESGIFSLSKVPPLLPDHTRTPVYPIWIGLFLALGLSPPWVVLSQLFLQALNGCLAYRLTADLSRSRRAAFWAGLFLAFDLPSIALANLLMSETLFTTLVLLAATDGVRFARSPERLSLLARSAIWLGFSILTRPIAMFLPPLAAFGIWIATRHERRRPMAMALLYVSISIAVLSPWLLRNRIVFGRTFLSTIGQTNLLYYRAAGVDSVVSGRIFDESYERMKVLARETYTGAEARDPLALKDHEERLALRIIGEHPWIYARIHLLSMFNLLFRPLRGEFNLALGFSDQTANLIPVGGLPGSNAWVRFWRKTNPIMLVFIAAQIVELTFLWTAFVFGLRSAFREGRWALFWLPLATIAYFTILSGGPEAYARFRVPIVPFIAAVAGLGAAKWREKSLNFLKNSCGCCTGSGSTVSRAP